MNWKPPAGANVHHKGAEIANSTRLAASATCLAQRAGATITTRAASAGQASSAVSTHWRYMGYRTAAPSTARTPMTKDRKSTRLNSSHSQISYAVFCLKKKKTHTSHHQRTVV